MKALLAICKKDLRLLIRDRGALFWAGIFPVLFAVLFAAVFPSSRNAHALPVASSGDASAFASCSAIEIIPAKTNADADALVRRGEAVAAVHFSSDGIELVVDPMHPAEGAVVEAAITRAMLGAAQPSFHFARRALSGASVLPSGFALAFPAAVLWGLIGCAGAFATASVAERRSGTHMRLRSHPISTASIVGGKVLACLVASFCDVLLLLIVAHFIFRVRIEHAGAFAMAIASAAVCFAGITVLLGTLGKNEQSVGGAGWAILLLFAMIGGAMVPLSVMPTWLRTVSDASPVKWGIVALEGATFRGLTLRELAPACGVLLFIGTASLGSAAAVTHRNAT